MANFFTLFKPRIVKKIIACFAFIFFASSAYSFTLVELLRARASCNQSVIYIPASLYADMSNVTAYFTVSDDGLYDGDLFSGSASLTDNDYFQYLGTVQFDASDNTSIYYAYRSLLNYTGTNPTGVITTDIEIDNEYGWYNDFWSINSNCLSCPVCPSREAMLKDYSSLSNSIFGDSWPYSDYYNSFNNLPSDYDRAQIVQVLNWMYGYDGYSTQPTMSDYADMLNHSERGESTVLPDFCVGSSYSNMLCAGQLQIFDIANAVNNVLEGGMTLIEYSDFEALLHTLFAAACIGGTNYYPNFWTNWSETGYNVIYTPQEAGQPTILGSVIFDGDNIYTTLAYSYNYSSLNGIVYNGSGEFSYQNGFLPVPDTDPYDDGVQPFPDLNVTASGPLTFCNGSSVTLTASSFMYYSAYSWSNSATTTSITATTSGTYSASVSDDIIGCPAVVNTIVTVYTPVSNPGTNWYICSSGSTTLGGSPAASGSSEPYTYSWGPTGSLSSATTANPTANPTVNTTYTLTVTDANTCTASNTITVSLLTSPSEYYWVPGATDNNWTDAGNWLIGGYTGTPTTCVPNDGDIINIGTGSTATTVVINTSGNPTVTSVTLGGTGQVTISPATSQTLSVTGDISSTNTNSSSAFTIPINLTGTADQSWTGSAATISIWDLVVNKSSGTVTLNIPITVNHSVTLTQGIVYTTTTNILTFNNGTTVSSASNVSFVSGPVAKIGVDPFVFPVGKGSIYHPVAISAPATTTDEFNGEYFNSANSTTTLDGTTINCLSLCDYWALSHPTGSSTVNVTLFWDVNSCNIYSLSSLRVAQLSSDTWSAVTATNTTGSTLLSGSITTNSPIAVPDALAIGKLATGQVCNCGP